MEEQLFHILMVTSHIKKNPSNIVEKIRAPGSYTSLQAAKEAAHRCLFDAGYEREWFKTYGTKSEALKARNLPERTSLAVYAVAEDGTEFRGWDIPREPEFTAEVVDGKITSPLYYVVQADIEYDAEEGSRVKDINIEGVCKTYQEARDMARTVLLSEEDGIAPDSFAEYDEAAPGEKDCGYGETVVVRAVSDYGANYLVSAIKDQELEAVHLTEAAMEIL